MSANSIFIMSVVNEMGHLKVVLSMKLLGVVRSVVLEEPCLIALFVGKICSKN